MINRAELERLTRYSPVVYIKGDAPPCAQMG